jgi:hypothetical protein
MVVSPYYFYIIFCSLSLKTVLEKRHAVLFTNAYRVIIPKTGLHLANVGAAHHKHTKSALADTSADSQRQFVCQKHFVEGKSASVITICNRKLTVECSGVYAYAHGRYLKGTTKHVIPEENIAV